MSAKETIQGKKLLLRDEFREGVFLRDNKTCVICHSTASDAHHILERRLFSDGGYYLNNGASLCSSCHLKAEMTKISVEDIRAACKIEEKDKIINIPKYLHKYDYAEEEALTEHNRKLFEAEQEKFRKDQEEHIKQLAEEDRVKQNVGTNHTG
jgi:hypothetical protein